MRHALPSLLALLGVGIVAAACSGTTGDRLITFPAYASGAKGAGDPFSVDGWTIRLTYAHMYVGAVYLNEAPAQNGGTFNTPACIETGVYCGQVTTGLDVDLLSTEPQPFPVEGNGTADLAQSWELHLTAGDVDEPENTSFGVPDTADLVGTATRQSDGKVFSWFATVTIDASNRGKPSQEPGQPGLNPICKQRIIDFGGPDVQLHQGGTLRLTIDPRGWFEQAIDFSTLPSASSAQCNTDQSSMMGNAQYCIPDASNLPGSVPGSQQGQTLFSGIFGAGDAAFELAYSP